MKMTAGEVAETNESFLAGRGGIWDWDDFLSCELDDAYLDGIRIKCSNVSFEYPPAKQGGYCSEGAAITSPAASQDGLKASSCTDQPAGRFPIW
jgi:hypothetical protein